MSSFKQGGRVNYNGRRGTVIVPSEKKMLILFDGSKQPEEVSAKKCIGQRGRTSSETATRAAKFIKRHGSIETPVKEKIQNVRIKRRFPG